MKKEEFLSRAIVIHGEKYSYECVPDIVNVKEKYKIYCQTHRKYFIQLGEAHLRGSGCSKCGREITANKQRLSTEQFISKSVELHGELYDYSRVDYINNNTKVLIGCPVPDHGYFQQIPSSHLMGRGCRKCGRKVSADKQRSNKDAFIAKSIKIHKDVFDYSLVKYTKNSIKVSIICPVEDHGVFEIAPNHHLNGRGCPKCGWKTAGDKQRFTTDDFIIKATEKYGLLYDYSKVDYINTDTKILVGCKVEGHGYWEVTPYHHVQGGTGCPSCAKTGFNPHKSGSFYILKVTDDVIKFGITNNIDRRSQTIKSQSCFDIKVLYEFKFENGAVARDIESFILQDSSIIKEVVSRADMKQGYTETTYIYNLSKILQIVENFTNAPSL